MAALDESPKPTSEWAPEGQFSRCARCALVIRRTEMDIHLAHAHNIGQHDKKDKKKDRRSGKRRFSDE